MTSTARKILNVGPLLLAPLLFSCGSGEGGNSPAAVSAVCLKQAQIRCAKIKSCWDTIGIGDYELQRRYGDIANCEKVIKDGCSESLLRKDQPGTTEHTEKCSTAEQAQSCADFMAGAALPEAQCPSLVGKLANDKPCISNGQCAAGYCYIPADSLCGVCANRVPAGRTCDTTSDCMTGLTCQDAVSGVNLCKTPVMLLPAEAVCLTSSDCATSSCVGRTGMRVCKVRVANEGELCDPVRRYLPDCDSTRGLFCEVNPAAATDMVVAMTMPGFCRKRVVAKNGEPCNTVTDPATMKSYTAVCWAGGSCKRDPDPAMPTARLAQGVCQDRVGDGGVCFASSTDGPTCISPLRCVLDSKTATQGKCRRRDYSMCK